MKTLEDVCELLREVIRNQDNIMARMEEYDRENDVLLSATEAIFYLGIGRNTFYEWKRRGKVRPVVRNGECGYLRRDLKPLRR